MNKSELVETKYPFYYSLSGAKNTFGVNINEIFDLAIKGEIVLSVKISKEYISYSISTDEPDIFKEFGDFLNISFVTKNISKLPLEQKRLAYINLSKDDCKVLKISLLKQSVFESAFLISNNQGLEHRLVRSMDERIWDLKLDIDNSKLEVLRNSLLTSKQVEIINNLPKLDRKRFVNGVKALQSKEYLRRFVLIDADLEVDIDYEAHAAQLEVPLDKYLINTEGLITKIKLFHDVAFLAVSELNQTFAKELTITKNDIEISSNYEKNLVSVTKIPESSPYFVKLKLRDFNDLHALAEIGYQYFILEENKKVEPFKNILSAQVNYIHHTKKTIDAAVFFLNPKPHHNAGLHKHTRSNGSKCQFEYLLKESEKYWSDKDLGSPSDIDKYRRGFAEELHQVGYSHEKAIHGEFLSLPNELRIIKGIRLLSISKVFPKV